MEARPEASPMSAPDPEVADKWTDVLLEVAEFAAAAAIVFGWATGAITAEGQVGLAIVGGASVVLFSGAGRKHIRNRLGGAGTNEDN